MNKTEQINAFYAWIGALSIPANYCRQTLEAYSLNNAGDSESLFEVAKATALSYLDDEQMAIESGVAK